MDPILIVLICLAVIVGLIVAAIIAAIVLDVKGVSISAILADKREKAAAQKLAKKKEKNKALYSSRPVSLAVQPTATAPAQSEPVEQPAEEPAEEPVGQPVEETPQPIQPALVQPAEDGDDDEEDNLTQIRAVTENGKTRYIVIKYSKSFLAKLIQADDETKAYYSIIKNFLLSYKDVKCRLSWKRESFRCGRVVLARLRMRGKTLALELPLKAEEYEETKYHVEDLSHVKSCADVPCMYRIKNGRRARYALELIMRVMRDNNIQLNENAVKEDYALQYPYETTEALLGRNLIKELTQEDAQSGEVFKTRKSVTVAEADTLIKDEIAVELVQKAEPTVVKAAVKAKTGGESDRTKVGIVNIDTLSQYFNDGETVTLEEIKQRVPGINKNTTYIKVLARGTLDKSLTVYADNFSLQAVKMIVLTGGKAVKN